MNPDKLVPIVGPIAMVCILLFLGYQVVELAVDYDIKCINKYNCKLAYELANMVNNKNFDELNDKEDAFTKIQIFSSIEYPEDKQVCIEQKKHLFNEKTVFFVENHNGAAVIVDVTVDGQQVVFKE